MNEPKPAMEPEESREEFIRALAEGRKRFHQFSAAMPADERAAIRREALERSTGARLTHIGHYSLDAEIASKRHCENFIGIAQIPLGVVGPVKVRGTYVNEHVMVPMATTEGALLASINRGCSAISAAGGAKVYVEDVGMTRAPVFRTSGVEETQEFLAWIREHYDEIEAHTRRTSRFLRMVELRPQSLGSTVYLRFRFTCGDAMGMNMATIACDRVVRELIEPGTGIPCIALSGNFCVDKKPSAVNWQLGRGKRLHAEVVLDADVLAKKLKTNAKSLVEAQYRKNLIGSIAAGATAYNAQVANVLSAFFIATGQDIAHVVEGAQGLTCIEPRGNDGVYASITLPDVPLGAVGGGTGLATQREALDLIGIKADPDFPGMAAMRLGEILAACVLAGELSLMSAFTSNDLASAHEKLGRGSTTAKTTGEVQRQTAPSPRIIRTRQLEPVCASAPGKLILAGEHAAVYGYPAMVAAIDLRLDVSITPTPGHDVEFDLPQMGFSGRSSWDDILRTTENARDEWQRCFVGDLEGKNVYRVPVGGPDQLVKIALGEVSQYLGKSTRPGMKISIDSKLPVGSGFGSSAAVGVGVTSAFLTALGEDLDRDEILRLSLEVERRQHGTPSGVDNTAVLDGGLLWAQRDDSGNLNYERIPADSPLLNRFRIFHSGAPAEPTGDIVAAVRRKIQNARERLWGILGKLGDATMELRTLLLQEDAAPGRILILVRQCEQWLEELGVVPKSVRKVIRRIEEMGGAAKISGAGALTGNAGGSVLIYHEDPDAIASWDFLKDWSALPVRLGAEGVRVEISR